MADDFRLAGLPEINFEGKQDAIVAEAIDELKKDKRILALIRDDLKLTVAQVKKGLPVLLDYKDDLHYCDHCPGLEKCAKAMRHYQIKVGYSDGVLDRKYCLCPKAAELETRLRKYFIMDFPTEWVDMRLSDVEKTEVKRKALIAAAKIASGESNWLYIHGNLRSGRTFLAACLANQFAEDHEGIAFCDTTKLIENLKDLNFTRKEEFGEKMRKLGECPLLVLDDFGNENKDKTGFGFSTILFPLLNERAKRGLPTVFTSDFTITDIEELYRPTIGPRAKQLAMLLRSLCKKEYDLTGTLNLH